MAHKRRVHTVAAVAAVLVCSLDPSSRAGERDRADGGIVWTPPTAGTGKPVIFVPPPQPATMAEKQTCLPALPCGSRLIGAVQKDGVIELKVPAWRW